MISLSFFYNGWLQLRWWLNGRRHHQCHSFIPLEHCYGIDAYLKDMYNGTSETMEKILEN